MWPLYKSGIISKEDISRHPQKNLITRSIGTQPQVEADLQKGEALKGDVYLLCSDGLTDVLSDQDILRLLTSEEQESSGTQRDARECCKCRWRARQYHHRCCKALSLKNQP